MRLSTRRHPQHINAAIDKPSLQRIREGDIQQPPPLHNNLTATNIAIDIGWRLTSTMLGAGEDWWVFVSSRS